MSSKSRIASGRVLAVGDVIVANAGEVAGTMVALPSAPAGVGRRVRRDRKFGHIGGDRIRPDCRGPGTPQGQSHAQY